MKYLRRKNKGEREKNGKRRKLEAVRTVLQFHVSYVREPLYVSLCKITYRKFELML